MKNLINKINIEKLSDFISSIAYFYIFILFVVCFFTSFILTFYNININVNIDFYHYYSLFLTFIYSIFCIYKIYLKK